jgi:hypothetical protein
MRGRSRVRGCGEGEEADRWVGASACAGKEERGRWAAGDVWPEWAEREVEVRSFFSKLLLNQLFNSNSIKLFPNFFAKFYKLLKLHRSNHKTCKAK